MINLVKYKLSLWMILLVFISCSDHPSHSGNKQTPQRIVSLSPHITEILYALEMDESIVAVTDFCISPPQAAQKTSIGGLLNPNLERLISLRPDVLIGSLAHSDLAFKLRDKNFNFVLLPDRKLSDIFAGIDSLGKLLKVTDRSILLIKNIRDSLNNYQRRTLHHNEESPRVVFLFGGKERNLSVIGPGTYTDDLWSYIGGKNAFANLQSGFAQINRESFYQADPDIIIEFRPEMEESHRVVRIDRSEWADFSHLKAVKNNQLYRITGQYALIPGPRIILLAKSFYDIMNFYSQKNASDH